MTEPKPKWYHKPCFPKEPEEDIQAKIVQFLRMEGWVVFEFAKPRSRPLCPKCGAAVGHLAGSVPEGFGDLLAIRGQDMFEEMVPRYLHLEIKRPGEQLEPKQREMKAQLEAQGCLFFRVESLEEMAAILKGLGYKLRTGVRI